MTPLQRWDPRKTLPKLPWRWQRRRWHGTHEQIDRHRIHTLRQIVDHAKDHPAIRHTALRILRAYLAPARDHRAQARAIQAWVQSNIPWVAEPGDQFHHPLRTLLSGGGDCDDHATLTASLLEAIRLPTRLVIMKRNGRGVHVYPAVGLPPRAPTEWIPCETSLPGVPLGWDPTTASADEIRQFT